MPGPDDQNVSHEIQQYEVGDRRLTVAVVESVASFSDSDPAKLPQLSNHVDTDALAQLVANTDDLTVRFGYDRVEVEIENTGEITVTDHAD